MTEAAESCHVQILTAPGRGAVAVIVVSGAAAAERAAHFFNPSGAQLTKTPIGRIRYGRWREHGEEVVVCRLSERAVEIHCNGGRAASERIVTDLLSIGCVLGDAELQVDSLSGATIREAALTALAAAPTERCAAILLDQYNGALERALQSLADDLRTGDVAKAAAAARNLLDTASIGLHLTIPWRVVIAGPPNAGKSSLLNALLVYTRAIVFDQPGTTRDAVSAQTALDGWPVELTDTAGLREAADPLESAGIERAQQQIAAADQIVLVFDGAAPFTAHDAALLAAHHSAIAVINKIDLASEMAIGKELSAALRVSALTGEGLDTLCAAIVARLAPHPPQFEEPIIFTTAQAAALQQINALLATGDLPSARAAVEQLLLEPVDSA